MDHNRAAEEIYDEIYNRALFFAQKLTLYQTRCYDISTRESSDIQEDIEKYFTPAYRVMLRHSIDQYKSSGFFEKYVPYADYENRYERLKAELIDELTKEGRTLSNSKFICLSALYVLTACDLKDKAGFDDAAQCVVEAITEAIVGTKQQDLLQFWYDSFKTLMS